MFGYATIETDELMPLPIMLAHKIAKRLSEVRKAQILPYLRPDGKTQVTIRYEIDEHGHQRPVEVVRVLVSTQHRDGLDMEALVKPDLIEHVLHPILPRDLYDERRFDERDFVLVNPTGKFVVGGPMGDTGLTGRKIIVDTYGGAARHGGGAFSGKDPTKVDRSAAYAARYVAKNVVAAGIADRCELQVSYAIGVAHPVSIEVDCFGTERIPLARIAEIVGGEFDLRPGAILRDLDLWRPIYAGPLPTATSAARSTTSRGSAPTRPTPSGQPPGWLPRFRPRHNGYHRGAMGVLTPERRRTAPPPQPPQYQPPPPPPRREVPWGLIALGSSSSPSFSGSTGCAACCRTSTTPSASRRSTVAALPSSGRSGTLHSYHAATGNFQQIVDLHNDTGLPDAILGSRTLYVAHGTVDATVDFSNVDGDAIDVTGDRRGATITLPRPQLSAARIDPTRSYVYDQDEGALNKIGNLFSANDHDQQELNTSRRRRSTRPRSRAPG